MRVTQNILFNQVRNNLMNNSNSLLRAQETVATQKRFNRLSENPIDGGRALDMTQSLDRIDRYLANIDRASSVTTVHDQTLGEVNDLIGRVKTLLLSEANEVTSTSATRDVTRIEIAIITDQIGKLANTQFDGQYIFSGFATGTPAFTEASMQVAPASIAGRAAVTAQQVVDSTQLAYHTYQIQFTAADTFDIIDQTKGLTILPNQSYTSGGSIQFDGMEIKLSDSPGAPQAGDTFTVTSIAPGAYQGDSQHQEIEIQAGTRIQQNITGDRIFQGVGMIDGIDLFDTLKQVNEALASNDRTAISNLLDDLDKGRDQISNERANVGARAILLESVRDRQEDIRGNLEILKSNIEDIDVAEALTAMAQQQNLYEATLGAASQIIQPSLLDFLR